MTPGAGVRFEEPRSGTEDGTWTEAEVDAGIPYAKIFVSTVWWCAFYFFLQYFNARKGSEWNCRIVTCVHALVITALSIYSAFILGPSPVQEPGRTNTNLELNTLILCLGYFIYDLVWCLYHQSEGIMIMVHHVASIVCLILPMNMRVSGGEVVVSIAAMEITNPILQLRWFLRESGYKNSPITTLVDFLFIAMFFLMRMVYGTYLLFAVTLHPRPYVIIKLGGASFCIISYIFMYMIFRYAYRKYVLKSKRPEEHVANLGCNGKLNNAGVPSNKDGGSSSRPKVN